MVDVEEGLEGDRAARKMTKTGEPAELKPPQRWRRWAQRGNVREQGAHAVVVQSVAALRCEARTRDPPNSVSGIAQRDLPHC